LEQMECPARKPLKEEEHESLERNRP
jgi:hypothetical protein